MLEFFSRVQSGMMSWLLTIVMVQAALLVMLLIILLVHKIKIQRHDQRKTLLKERCFHEICRHLIYDDSEVNRPSTADEYEVFTECCIDLLLTIAGNTSEKVKQILRDYGIVEYYCRMATSPIWLRRFYALERLGLFAVDELKEFFLDSFGKERVDTVRNRALWALSCIADGEIFKKITDVLAHESSNSGKFNESLYGNMIRSMKRKGFAYELLEIVDETLRRDEVPLPLRKDLIESCGSAKFVESVGSVIDYFERHQNVPEIRIACIRASGRIADSLVATDRASDIPIVLVRDVIIPALSDRDWRVRAVAAGAAVVCGGQAIPLLVQLLYDKVYYVRINAGRALAEIGQEGRAALLAEAASTDRFVRDTVHFVLQ